MTRIRWKDTTEEFRELLREAKLINGCGPKNKILAKLVPEDMFGLLLTPSCEQHDFNYILGHTEADRVKADWQFYEAIRAEAINRTKSWWKRWLRPLYFLVARTYYIAVRLLGESSFYYGPRERSLEDIEELLTQANI